MGVDKGPHFVFATLFVVTISVGLALYKQARDLPENQVVERPCYMPFTWMLLDSDGVPESVVYKDVRRIPFCDGEMCRVREQVSYTVLIQSDDPVEVERFCSYEGR